jgi:hypothetical protein
MILAVVLFAIGIACILAALVDEAQAERQSIQIVSRLH